MNSADDIKKMMKKLHVPASEKLDKKIHRQLLDASTKRNIYGRLIFKLSAAAVIVLGTCLFIINDKPNSKQPIVIQSPVKKETKTPAELMSFCSLTITFRDGGMEAVQKQCEKAEEKVKSEQKEKITVDEILCELGQC